MAIDIGLDKKQPAPGKNRLPMREFPKPKALVDAASVEAAEGLAHMSLPHYECVHVFA